MSKKGSYHTYQGDFHPSEYIRLLYDLLREQKTGVLSLVGPRKKYQMQVIAGHIVGASGGSKQTLSRSLVELDILNETELIRAQAWAGDGGSIENALIELGVMTQEEMNESAEMLLASQIHHHHVDRMV